MFYKYSSCMSIVAVWNAQYTLNNTMTPKTIDTINGDFDLKLSQNNEYLLQKMYKSYLLICGLKFFPNIGTGILYLEIKTVFKEPFIHLFKHKRGRKY